jgi:hypothetical protein
MTRDDNGRPPALSVPAPADPTTALILDFLEWLSPEPRPYPEVMEAWRTSCPRLTVWEDAIDRGWVRREQAGRGAVVALTASGAQRLRDTRRRLAG